MGQEQYRVKTYSDGTTMPAFDFSAPWKERAACAGEWELFDLVDLALHPIGKMTPRRRADLDAVLMKAVDMCADCPVKAECTAAVVPPQSPAQSHAYSIVAGKVHVTYHPDWTPIKAKRRPAGARQDCPRCGKSYAAQNLAQHLASHDVVIPHGTWKGYNLHRVRSEKPCEACREAMRLKSAQRRAAVKERTRQMRLMAG